MSDRDNRQSRRNSGNKGARNNKRKNPVEELRGKRVAKLNLIVMFFIISLIGLGAITFYIQVRYGNEYERAAIMQQVERNSVDKQIKPNRGTIVDRYENTQPLAISTTVYNVIFDVNVFLKIKDDMKENEQIEYQKKILETINKHFAVPVETLEGYIIDRAESNYVIIAKRVSGTQKKAFEEENISNIVWFEDDTFRKYPGNGLAASLIGFTWGDDNNWGIEATYNGELSGTTGRVVRMYDKDNNPNTEKIDPIKGHTVVTTIDLTLQQEAQRVVSKYGAEAESENAALILMDPNTGQILAMAEYPTFDLNDPSNIEKIDDESLKASVMLLPQEEQTEFLYDIWGNYAISHTFEPGSIYKPLVVAAALEEGIITSENTYYCGGSKVLYDRNIPCNNGYAHGHQNVTEVLANSCNVGMIEIIGEIGREKYYKYQMDFGVGELTGIDLSGEAGDASTIYYTLSQLNPVELGVASMGQGFNMTSLQMITAFSSVINGGNVMKPYVVSQILDENNNIVVENEPTVLRKVISKETSDWMKEALEAVVSPSGTGKKAVIDGYRIGGKTGTAQQGVKTGDGDEPLTLTFIEYFPADNPEYIMITVINEPKNYVQGNALTIPMARDMTQYIINNKRITPSNSSEEGSEPINDNDTIPLEDYKGNSIARTINSLNYLGYVYEVSGNGSVVKSQIPSAGSKVSKGSKIFITLEGEDTSNLTLVPDVSGMTKEQAIDSITRANLVPVIKENAPNIGTAEGETPETEVQQYVVSQLISQIKIEAGTEIIIYVE